jgi:hypothetical protein
MIISGRTASCVMLLVLLRAGFGLAAEPSWGTLQMRFVYEGKPPALREFPINKDEAACAKEKLFDESLLVNAKNGGLSNVIVWMAGEKGQKLPVEHADHIAAAKKEVKLDTVKCRFEPRVSLIRTNQPLFVENRDSVGHNENVRTIENKQFAATIPTGRVHRHAFDKAESAPASIVCNIHPWMSGWVLIQDHPYMAISDADGDLEIPHVPAGKWKFIAWHERVGWLSKVTVNDRIKQWEKGSFEVEIKRGDVDLGTIKLSPEVFKK